MATVREEYYVILPGNKRHPTYPGVLIAAHEEGLLGIEVTVLQYPTSENGGTAVCSATVTMKGDGETKQFYTEIGDAAASSVGSRIVPHIIRMAATRAKGRALRDAIALGVALVEELGPDADETPRQNGQQRPQEPATPPQRARHDPVDEQERATGQVRREEQHRCEWQGCGRALTNAQATLSKHRHDAYLCAEHQARQPKKEVAAA